MTDLSMLPPPSGAAVSGPAIALRGLVKRFGELIAVKGIDLDVPRGSFFGLVGPNGAGMTKKITLAAPADVAVGQVGTGLLRLVLGLGVLGATGLLWQRAVRRQVEDPAVVGRADSSRGHEGLGLLGRFPETETGAIAAQVATYWRRDPRYQVGLLMAPVTPLFLLIPSLVGGQEWPVLLMGPLIAFLIGWSEHNCVAYESTAFWMHVAAGTTGRADRLARLLPSLAMASVLVPVYCMVGAWLGGRMDLLPAIVGVSVALAGVGYGLSCVMSVVMPYPVPKPGESPFATPPGGQGARLLAQLVSSTGTALLASPVILLALLTWWEHDWALWPTALSGILLGSGVLVLGIRLGGRIYDRRGPELLAELESD